MSTSPLVSIVIPSYNRKELTLNAIESALNQTYEPIEVIVVDDGSKVPLSDSIPAYHTDSLSVLRHDVNRGANAARNTGWKSAKGEWIAFLDSDDTWEQDKISSIMEQLLNHSEYSIAYCSVNFSIDGSVVNTKRAKESGDLYEMLLVDNVVGSASVPIINIGVLCSVGGLDESLKSAQDWDLWLRIADAGYKFLAIDEPLVHYKMPDSTDHISGSIEAFWQGRKEFIEKHKSKYKSGHIKSLGVVYSNAGFLFLNRFHDNKRARHCFFNAIKYNFFRLKSWKGLIGSILPTSIYKNYFIM